MPATWKMWSNIVYGEVVEISPENERYVVTQIIASWVDEGLTNEQVFLRYNAGGATRCSSGVNKYGVKYDSCAYVAHGMQHLAMI